MAASPGGWGPEGSEPQTSSFLSFLLLSPPCPKVLKQVLGAGGAWQGEAGSWPAASGLTPPLASACAPAGSLWLSCRPTRSWTQMGTGHYQKGKPRYPTGPFTWDSWRGLPQGDLRARGPKTGWPWAPPVDGSQLAPGQGCWGAHRGRRGQARAATQGRFSLPFGTWWGRTGSQGV